MSERVSENTNLHTQHTRHPQPTSTTTRTCQLSAQHVRTVGGSKRPGGTAATGDWGMGGSAALQGGCGHHPTAGWSSPGDTETVTAAAEVTCLCVRCALCVR